MKNSKHRSCLQLLCLGATAVLSLLLGAHSGTAAQPQSANPQPLRVGVSPVFPPMVFKQGKELAGVEVDLARALGQQLGRKVQFVEVPWADQVEALKAGKTDIIMSSMSITPARKFMVDFSKSYFVISQLALVRREDESKYPLGFPMRPKDTVGVIKATTGEFLVQRDFPKAKRKSFDSADEAAKALMKKKIDLFISDSPLVWYLAGLHATDGLSAVRSPLNEEQLAWAVRKGDDPLLAAVNQFLSQAQQDGRLIGAFRRWMAVEN